MKPGAAFVGGLCAAPLATLPALTRFHAGLRWQAFIVCTAGCALFMAPLAAALTRSAVGSRYKSALVLGALIGAVPLLPFAALLKSSTHHRPLGGVTFAAIGGLLLVCLSLFSARLVTRSTQNFRAASVARWVVVALAALGSAALLLGLIDGLRGGRAYRTGFFDALRVLGLTALVSRMPLPPRVLRSMTGFGLAAWVLVVTVGVCLGRAPAMRAELADVSPVLQWPLVWLGG